MVLAAWSCKTRATSKCNPKVETISEGILQISLLKTQLMAVTIRLRSTMEDHLLEVVANCFIMHLQSIQELWIQGKVLTDTIQIIWLVVYRFSKIEQCSIRHLVLDIKQKQRFCKSDQVPHQKFRQKISKNC